MGQFEAEFDDVSVLQEARASSLDAVHMLWSRVQQPNDTLPTSRKFIIGESPNNLVPVAHESVVLVPKPRATTIGGVVSVKVRVPYLPSQPRAERRLDPRYAFVELQRPHGVYVSRLLGHGEYTTYKNAGDIHVVEQNDDRTYYVSPEAGRAERVAAGVLSFEDLGVDFTPTQMRRPLDELTSLTELTTLLQTYDPDLQDNLPSMQR